MSPRRADPRAPFKMIPHRSNGYLYAATCETVTREDGRRSRRYTHWGALEDGNRFVPNLRFLTLDPCERTRLIFPAGWDLTEIEGLVDEADVGGMPAGDAPLENKLYGDVWLLLRVSELRGVTQDLMTVLCHRTEFVNDVLTLAIYSYLTERSLSRLPRWQRTYKVPATRDLTPGRIARLTRSITRAQVMEFFSLRIARQPDGAFFACCTTKGDARHSPVAEMGHGRDEDDRDRSLEAVVWSSTVREPVYHRSFPGTTSYAHAVPTIVEDLSKLGVEDLFIVYEHDLGSADDMGALLDAGLPFLAHAGGVPEPVDSRLCETEWGANGLPVGMDHDAEEQICHTQLPLGGSSHADRGESDLTVADDGLVCDLYLDMRERVTRMAGLTAAVAEERGSLEAMSDTDLLALRTRIDDVLRYHRVDFERDDGGRWHVAGRREATDRVEREKATCGFSSTLAWRVPGAPMEHLRVCHTRDEQESFLAQTEERMGPVPEDRLAHPGDAGRSLCALVALILGSAVSKTWQESAELRREFPSPADVLDEMRDIRWYGCPDGGGHLGPFLASQVRVCEAFRIEVPHGCLPTSGRDKEGDVERRSVTSPAKGRRPARNRAR